MHISGTTDTSTVKPFFKKFFSQNKTSTYWNLKPYYYYAVLSVPFYLDKPLFYQAMCFSWHNWLAQRHLFLLRWLHRNDLFLNGEFKLCDSFKTFFEMWLNSQWIFGLWQYFQQFIIRQEEKSVQDKLRKYVKRVSICQE